MPLPDTVDPFDGEKTAGLPERARTVYEHLRLVAQLLREAPPGEGPRLLWRDAQGVARSIPVGGGLTLGRAPECDLVLTDPNVSRRHCGIAVTAAGIVVTDLRSRHGTLLNGLPVTHAVLKEGDWLQLGSVGLCLMLT